jgi:hypothetical protein
MPSPAQAIDQPDGRRRPLTPAPRAAANSASLPAIPHRQQDLKRCVSDHEAGVPRLPAALRRRADAPPSAAAKGAGGRPTPGQKLARASTFGPAVLRGVPYVQSQWTVLRRAARGEAKSTRSGTSVRPNRRHDACGRRYSGCGHGRGETAGKLHEPLTPPTPSSLSRMLTRSSGSTGRSPSS